MSEEEKKIEYEQISRYRKYVFFSITAIYGVCLFFVTLFNHYFHEFLITDIVLLVSIIYLLLYAKFVPEYTQGKARLFICTASVFLFNCFFVFFTGGNSSIFLSIFYFCTFTIGISLEVIPLVVMTAAVEGFLIVFFFINSDKTVLEFVRNSFMDIMTFFVAYLVMHEYSRKEKQIYEIKAIVLQQKNINEERDKLIGIVSHELRNPVTILKGSISLLFDKANKKISQHEMDLYLKNTWISIGNLETIIEKTIAISGLDTNTLNVSFSNVDLEEMLTTLINGSLKDAANNKHLSFTLQLPNTHLSKIAANYHYLSQAITYIIDNAIKFTLQGSVTIKALEQDTVVTLEISDTGIGISRQYLSNIFHKFNQEQDYLARTNGGIGLGLYVAKAIIEKHKGTIEVKSEVNKGTTVIIKLPISSDIHHSSMNVLTPITQTNDK